MTDDASAGPVWHRDLPYLDPFDAATAFGETGVLALLDSTGEPERGIAGHSYLCVDPFSIVEARDGRTHIDGVDQPGEPLDVLGQLLGRYRIPPDPGGFPFRGGVVGYIGYEAGARLEAIPIAAGTADDPPDLFMGCYDLVIGFDRRQHRCRVHSSGLPHTDPATRAAHAASRLDWACARLAACRPVPRPSLPELDWTAQWTKAAYELKASRVLDYIAAGDIFQANLTMRTTASRPAGLDASSVHAALRRANPAPFGAWLRCGPHDLCCSSPERFISLTTGGAIETSPIKGTIARAADGAADLAARASLAGSAKDRAENVMIVDVLRNDLGRVASLGSIAVPELCAVVSTATLHHLVSRITARLRDDVGSIALLRAALPGGSITGAPKIRAMQIIAELEVLRRGPYCGCVAWMGFDGAMDSNIVIRSLVLTPQRVIAQAGGGVVADSQPSAEHDEMMLKRAPMLSIFGADR